RRRRASPPTGSSRLPGWRAHCRSRRSARAAVGCPTRLSAPSRARRSSRAAAGIRRIPATSSATARAPAAAVSTPPPGRASPLHAYRAVLPLVVDHAVDYRVGDDGQVAGFLRRRQRRAQAREVAAVAAAAGALVPRLAAPAAVVRLGQIRDPRDRHVAPGERALDPPPHDVLGTVHLPRREEVTVRQVREA